MRGWLQVRVARWEGQGWRYDSFAAYGTDFSNPRFLVGDDGMVELAIDVDRMERRYELEGDAWVPTERVAPRNEVASTSGVLDWSDLEQGELDSPCTEERGSRQISSRFVSSAQSPSDPEKCLVTWVEDSGSHFSYNDQFYVASFEVRAKLGRRDAWMPLGILGGTGSTFGTMSSVIGADERPVVAYSAVGRYWSSVGVGVWNGTEWRMWGPRHGYGEEVDHPRLSTTAEGKVQLEVTRNRVPERYVLEGDEWLAAPAPVVQ